MKCDSCMHYRICQDIECLAEDEHCNGYEDKRNFIKLPCKVGDLVYFEVKGYDHWHTYQNFIQKQEITMIILRNDFIKFQTASETYYLEDFGKTVFLTREEAEAALEKMKERDKQ